MVKARLVEPLSGRNIGFIQLNDRQMKIVCWWGHEEWEQPRITTVEGARETWRYYRKLGWVTEEVYNSTHRRAGR